MSEVLIKRCVTELRQLDIPLENVVSHRVRHYEGLLAALHDADQVVDEDSTSSSKGEDLLGLSVLHILVMLHTSKASMSIIFAPCPKLLLLATSNSQFRSSIIKSYISSKLLAYFT